MVFDKFKSWRKDIIRGTICPSCQHENQSGTKICTRCYYQIEVPSFLQESGMNDEQASDLLDLLASEIEEENHNHEEAKPASFSMDDLVVEVSQYGDDDSVEVEQNPSFDSIMSTVDTKEEEEYQLTEDDIPQFIKKFEVPEENKEDPVEESENDHRIELIHPNSETPSNVKLVPSNEVPETNDWSRVDESKPKIDPADFDGDGKVDEFESAFANPMHDNLQNLEKSSNSVNDGKVPRLSSTPVYQNNITRKNIDTIHKLEPIIVEKSDEDNNFWPWQQQDEWQSTIIAKQLKLAIEAAKERKIGEATVLLDEIGPHLGSRRSLVYSVGMLLISIGRKREATEMVISASQKFPDDSDINRAREKLIS